MTPRADLIAQLRECRERLRILLAFSVAGNVALVAIAAWALLR